MGTEVWGLLLDNLGLLYPPSHYHSPGVNCQNETKGSFSTFLESGKMAHHPSIQPAATVPSTVRTDLQERLCVPFLTGSPKSHESPSLCQADLPTINGMSS